MSLTWNYPIYLLPHQGGYASIVDPDGGADPDYHLVVYTDEEIAESQMAAFGLLGDPRPLHNDREFGWLLQSLQGPVRKVSFDPKPIEQNVNARWTVEVAALLADHLHPDNSPWNYPIFAIAEGAGFASIAGPAANGGVMALALFTTEERVHSYMKSSSEEGTICRLENLQEAVRFLRGLRDYVEAVALDPTVEDGRHAAQYCFTIDTLLEKYLVPKDNDSANS
ncbi:MAG: hypothetical protein QGG36_06350 [Pirellulaceae bacterium]|nr:hypothetical protein [Pirellulaceae bacterium]